MGKTAIKPSAWTREAWADDIIQQADIAQVAASDVEEMDASEMEPDLVEACQQAAQIERMKASIILREYGREYCAQFAGGAEGKLKAMSSFANDHIDGIIEVAGDEDAKPKQVAKALVAFGQAFADRFAS